MKILVCEGEEVLLTAIEFRLRRHGFDVEIAKDAEETLEKLKAGTPDLLLVDLEMPDLAGLELIEQVKRENEKLPVVVIADLENEAGILNSFKAGVHDFVTKPFKPVELALRIRRILEIS
ncbi:MAG: response regulator [Saprospiraceae bacterium]|nr:response regulator [Saprospiraceae bacterium]